MTWHLIGVMVTVAVATGSLAGILFRTLLERTERHLIAAINELKAYRDQDLERIHRVEVAVARIEPTIAHLDACLQAIIRASGKSGDQT